MVLKLQRMLRPPRRSTPLSAQPRSSCRLQGPSKSCSGSPRRSPCAQPRQPPRCQRQPLTDPMPLALKTEEPDSSLPRALTSSVDQLRNRRRQRAPTRLPPPAMPRGSSPPPPRGSRGSALLLPSSRARPTPVKKAPRRVPRHSPARPPRRTCTARPPAQSRTRLGRAAPAELPPLRRVLIRKASPAPIIRPIHFRRIASLPMPSSEHMPVGWRSCWRRTSWGG